MEMTSASSGDASCPPWCELHHEVSPDYWVHQGPAVIVRSDYDRPLARVLALIGIVSGEDFGPQVNVELVTTKVVENEGSHTYSPVSLSPEEAQRLAAALGEAARALDGYPRA